MPASDATSSDLEQAVERTLRAGLAVGPAAPVRAAIDPRVEAGIAGAVRPSRRLALHPGRWPLAVAAALLLLVVAGSAVATAPAYVPPAGEAAEANAEAARLAWPAARPSFGVAEVGGFIVRAADGSSEAIVASCPPRATCSPVRYMFGTGLGTARADIAWLCAWSGEWLNTRDVDPARAAAALRQLDKVKALTAWRSVPGFANPVLSDAVAAAKAGDPGPIRIQRQALGCRP